jgi:bifunctional UDP-N-acetylglucosamine pyrophosphorylase/glucosamine-1-phosphate N-acetyltransferase
MTATDIVILAAGKGTRMRSALPKVLHLLAGRALLDHVLYAAAQLNPASITVVVAEDFAHPLPDGVRTVVQRERLGTGHAVQTALAQAPSKGANVLVLYGDTPLLTIATMQKLLQALDHSCVAALGFEPADPAQYGRLYTDGARLLGIIEYADATAEQRAIRLCNAGIMAFRRDALIQVLPKLSNKNAKGEYYLTDTVSLVVQAGYGAAAVRASDPEDVLGVNSRAELAVAEAIFQRRMRHHLLEDGVTMPAPETVWLSADLVCAADVTIEPFVVLGNGVVLEAGARVRAFSHLEQARVGRNAVVGPYARLRPGAVLAEDAHAGNFVEIKNAVLGAGAKANHLSYLGDAVIGAGANIGAGTITCNYDGAKKHRTTVGANAFIGSNTALVAPVSVGDGATVGAGSVITKDVPSGALGIARAVQKIISGWKKKA